ncbi:MAG: FGGY-family carbohydrate kinase [Elainellaceae cyanobacterium]
MNNGDGFSLGIDFGTSGARAIAIDANQVLQAEARYPFDGEASSDADQWKAALFDLLAQLPTEIRARLTAIAINGTSGTVLRCDRYGTPVGGAILYNDSRGRAVLERIEDVAPPDHVVRSASSSLAKLLWWHRHDPLNLDSDRAPAYFLHQADWLAFLLHGQLGVSDYHNSLKLGVDVETLTYPSWFASLFANQPMTLMLPRVVAPGMPVGPVQPLVIERYGIPEACQVCAGTTDSIAAFLASGAVEAGEAVTSLGSTLVLKLLSPRRVEQASSGIYSHRFGDRWLVGGASNTGGAVLAQFFSPDEIEALSQHIDPDQDSGFDYYPLLQPGERFPINDPDLPPRLTPCLDAPAAFLQGLLEGIARIESLGYHTLQDLGAAPLIQVYSAGGGAQNAPWSAIRSRYLGVPVAAAVQSDAAYGTARLAQNRSLL